MGWPARHTSKTTQRSVVVAYRRCSVPGSHMPGNRCWWILPASPDVEGYFEQVTLRTVVYYQLLIFL